MVEKGHDDRKTEVIEILNRILVWGGRSERWSNQKYVDTVGSALSRITCCDSYSLSLSLSKTEIVERILGVLTEDDGHPQPPPDGSTTGCPSGRASSAGVGAFGGRW